MSGVSTLQCRRMLLLAQQRWRPCWQLAAVAPRRMPSSRETMLRPSTTSSGLQ